MVLVPDNATCHKKDVVIEYLQQHGISFESSFPPRNTPDLNVIAIREGEDVSDTSSVEGFIRPRGLGQAAAGQITASLSSLKGKVARLRETEGMFTF